MDDKNNVNTDKKEVNSSNIFEEFDNDSNLVSEVEKLKKEQSKDVFYYTSLVGKVFQNIFFILLFLLSISLVYVYIQGDENLNNKDILNPVCFLLNEDIPNPDNLLSCSSLANTKNIYEGKLRVLKEEYAKKVLSVLSIAYEEKNFNKTKEILFLVNKTNTKLKTIEVLEKFDNLKLEFGGIDKRKIQCGGVFIDGEKGVLEVKCEAYSMGYEKGIIGFSGNKSGGTVGGTSISIANSFLNFIEKNSSDFTVVDKQKIFSSASVVGEKNGYTSKTSFDVKLKINF